ncbi:predicted protein [Nematostella vectensis]|uniref:CUB domain-containing protein n=1 Tax=Nematostella vectensis TaxID=45351 RepID=A7SMP7_NEMVE|nr:predicted protein [Nematostella vectensis]|eukprot:XP_001627125.1 predicted protein [Nematostella vectensis]
MLKFVSFYCTIGALTAGQTIVLSHVAQCHSHDVILECPHQFPLDSHRLDWLVDLPNGTRHRLAVLSYGDVLINQLLKDSDASSYHNRLQLFENGSLRIASLRPYDETTYHCVVIKASGLPVRKNIIKLNVSCEGKITQSSHEACTEDAIILPCPAKHRTNPRRLTGVRWSQHNDDGTWSPVAIADKFGNSIYAPHKALQVRLDKNGSLLLRGGRPEGKERYKCEAIKGGIRTPERHLVMLSNKVCNRITPTLKVNTSHSMLRPCFGSEMTVSCPALVTNVASSVRLVKWRSYSPSGTPRLLFHLQKGPGIQKWFLRAHNGSQNSRVRLGSGGELIVNGVTVEDRGRLECVVKTSHHHEPIRHIVVVRPVVCPTTTSSVDASIAQRKKPTTTAPLVPQAVTMGSVQVPTQDKRRFTKDNPQVFTIDNLQLPTEGSHVEHNTPKTKLLPGILIKARPTLYSKPTRVTTTTSNTVTMTESQESEGSVVDTFARNTSIECGETLHSLTGHVTSPNFPNGYPGNHHCRWTIRGPKHSKYSAIRLTLVKVSLEREQDCLYDYLAFEDELGNQVGCRHCALKKPGTSVLIKGRIVVVVFHSDATVNSAGFHLTYTVV